MTIETVDLRIKHVDFSYMENQEVYNYYTVVNCILYIITI